MKKKDVVFTIGLCIFTGIMWMAGELVMGLWIPVRPKVHLWWLIGSVYVSKKINRHTLVSLLIIIIPVHRQKLPFRLLYLFRVSQEVPL